MGDEILTGVAVAEETPILTENAIREKILSRDEILS